MNEGVLSPQWYRVAKLNTKLHSHVEIHRHDYRGLIWYLLEDTTTGRNHRFNPSAYQFIGLLDGEKSVDDIFNLLTEQLEDYAPGQEEIIQLLAQLHAADLIHTNVLVNTEELFDRQVEQKKSKLKQRFTNPITQKIPLWDPEDFLNKYLHRVRWLFSFPVAIIWFFFIAYTAVQAAINWPIISQHFTINALSPYNLIIVFLLYPLIKIAHELGHAFSAKLEGGEVHEMGINFMMFMPIPYVNVSTASHFRNKYKRMLVSAAGVLVESFLAALGLLLFLVTEPSLIQDIGFNIFMIGGISSLFFNGNPLLKYDGYYFLADAVAIPNLYQRSGQYWIYLFQRYLFGITHSSSPATASGEAIWFVFYSILSQLYRLAILWFIFVIVTEKFFVLGIILGTWLVSMQIILPVLKGLMFTINNPMVKQNRVRAVVSSIAIIGLTIGFLGFVPLPSYTHAQGIVWQPDDTQITAQQDGFAHLLKVRNNQAIKAETLIVELQDPFLHTEAKILKAKVDELRSEYRAERTKDLVAASIVKESLKIAESELKFVLDKIDSMSIKSFKAGVVLFPDADDLEGRFVRQGELLGYILNDQPPTIRIAISQDNIGQLQNNIENIKVKIISELDKEYEAKIIRSSPEATHRLPSAALSARSGGKFISKPGQDDARLSLEKVFLVDLSFEATHAVPLGARVYVRINHGGEPLALQWYRQVRQVFLRQFNV